MQKLRLVSRNRGSHFEFSFQITIEEKRAVNSRLSLWAYDERRVNSEIQSNH